MGPETSRAVEGFFLSFPANEIADIRRALEQNGYKTDGEGLKELLLDALYYGRPDDADEESNTERFIRKTKSFIAKNPETIKTGMDLAAGIMRMVKERASRR